MLRRARDRRWPRRQHDGQPAGAPGAPGGAGREVPAPALSHRRIAAAGQRALVRGPGPARTDRGHRHAQVRRRIRVAAARPAQLRRIQPGLGRPVADGLASPPFGFRRGAVPPRPGSGCTGGGRLPGALRGLRCRRGHRARRNGRGAGPFVACALCGGRQRPRHPAGATAGHQAAQPPAQQRCHVRPLPGRAAAAGRQAAGQHQHLLVRARLVLVHPVGRWQHQRGGDLLAALPEVAPQTLEGLLLGHLGDVSPAGRTTARRYAHRRRGPGHRQLRLQCQPRLRRAPPDAG